MDAFAIVVLHECPLTKLERTYDNVTSMEMRTNTSTNLGILYKCNHEYEKQLDAIINFATMVLMKIVSIIVFKTFHFKLVNYNNIYV